MVLYLQLSLFFDVLLPMATGVTEDDFTSKNSEMLTKEIRQILWDELHDFKICPCMYSYSFFY